MNDNDATSVSLVLHGSAVRVSFMRERALLVRSMDVQALGSSQEIQGAYAFMERLAPRGHVFLDVPMDEEWHVDDVLNTNKTAFVFRVTIPCFGEGAVRYEVLEVVAGIAQLKSAKQQPTQDTRFHYRSLPPIR